MPVPRNVDEVSLVRCTYDWHHHRSCRKSILCIPHRVASVHLTVHCLTLIVRESHRFKIEVRLKWGMCQKELDTFENITLVLCS